MVLKIFQICFYTVAIQCLVQSVRERRIVERGSLYLPTKKIGKNNPKAEEIAKNNEMRQEWNATMDQALVSGADPGDKAGVYFGRDKSEYR